MILFVLATVGLVELGDVQSLVDRLERARFLGQLAFESDYLGNWLDIGRELLLDALEVVAIVVSDEIDRQTEVTVTS